MEALQLALTIDQPLISNTDQGSQFTDQRFTGVLADSGIRISMDGKGRYLDNILTERLWRTVKYEEVYPKGYGDLREGLEEYFHFYNTHRGHSALGGAPPQTCTTGNYPIK